MHKFEPFCLVVVVGNICLSVGSTVFLLLGDGQDGWWAYFDTRDWESHPESCVWLGLGNIILAMVKKKKIVVSYKCY